MVLTYHGLVALLCLVGFGMVLNELDQIQKLIKKEKT